MFVPLLASSQDSEWEQVRRQAESHHEIVALLVRQNNFRQVLPEMRKIFALRFPEKYESMLSQEIQVVADALMHKNQHDLALQVIDEGLKSLKLDSNKADVCRKKAHILKRQGKEDEALKCFKLSLELDARKSH